MTGGKHYKENLFFATGQRLNREPRRWDEYLVEAEESLQRSINREDHDIYGYSGFDDEDEESGSEDETV